MTAEDQSGNETNVPPENPRNVWIHISAIAVLTFIAYANSFGGIFLLDDQQCIVENPTIRSLSKSLTASKDETPSGLHRRPVGQVSFALTHSLSGLATWGFHLHNLMIHIACSLVLYDLVRRLVIYQGTYSKVASHIAFGVSLLWALHPVQTESVTYVVQRLESQASLFYLTTLYCLTLAVTGQRSLMWLCLGVVSCVLAMGTKEIAISIPLAAFLLDWIFFSDNAREVVKRRGWFHACLFVCMFVLLSTISPVKKLLGWAPSNPTTVASVLENPVEQSEVAEQSEVRKRYEQLRPALPSRWEYLGTQPRAVLFYLGLSFWPRSLCLHHAWQPSTGLFDLILPSILVVSLIGVTLYLTWKRTVWGFLGSIFFLVLIPSSSIYPLKNYVFEHRIYLPLACVIVVAILGVLQICGRLPESTRRLFSLRGAYIVLLAAAVSLLVLTYQRNRVYFSGEAMWRDVVAKSENSPAGHINLSLVLVEKGDFDKALYHAKRSLELVNQWGFAKANNTVGLVFNKLSRPREAEPYLRAAIEIDPGLSEAYINLGNALRRTSPQEATAVYQEAVRRNPRSSEAQNNLGAMLAKSDPRQASQHYQLAIQLQPDNSQAHSNFATLLARQGKYKQAIFHFRKAIEIDPNFEIAKRNLAIVQQMASGQR